MKEEETAEKSLFLHSVEMREYIFKKNALI
jgi:hypothetical protein